ncbi:MAG: hypothetical protein ABSH49_03890 [Bryobacteraceae bacterium]|jgi:hypothetical protein
MKNPFQYGGIVEGALAFAVVAVIALLVPFPHLLRPDWDVWVVDENGNAVEGMNVALIYQDYSIESRSHEETPSTDASGHARFNALRRLSTAGAHIMGVVRSFSETGVHASFGRYAYVVVFGKGRRAEYPDAAWTGSPPNKRSRIIARPDWSAP